MAMAAQWKKFTVAIVLLTARQLYCTGRDETWPSPVSAVLAKVHPRFGSPWAATLVTGAIAGALCFIQLKLLIIATGTSVAVVYAFLCLSTLAGRKTGSTA